MSRAQHGNANRLDRSERRRGPPALSGYSGGIAGLWHWGCSYLLETSGPRGTSHCLIRLDTLLGSVRSSASDLTAAVIRTCLRPVGRGRSMHQRLRGNLTRRLSGAGTIVFRSTTTWGRRGRRTDHQRIQTVKPEVTLEVGFGCGISTLFVCDALVANDTECKHIVLDPYQRTIFRNIGLQYVQRPGYEHLIPYTRRHLNRLYRDFSPREHEFKPISRT